MLAMSAVLYQPGTRGMETQYNRPKLEDILPYDDDEQGNVTYINKVTGKMEKTSPAKTGCNIASVNRQIMSVARDAALVYATTGEERYGRMAANVFEVYMKGIACRNVPVDLNHGHQQTLVGMTTFEEMPAHNTVVVDGVSSYPVMMSQHGFKLIASILTPLLTCLLIAHGSVDGPCTRDVTVARRQVQLCLCTKEGSVASSSALCR